MERAPELQALQGSGESVVADRGVKGKQLLGFGLLGLVGIGALYLNFTAGNTAPRDMLQSEEAFNTETFSPPGFVRDSEEAALEPEVEPNIVVIPPPPPPAEAVEPEPDVAEFTVPPPPPMVPSPPMVEPTLIVQEPAPVVEEEFPERYLSGLVVMDVSAPDKGLSEPAAFDGNARPPAIVSGTDSASQYLASSISQEDRSANARSLERIDALVPEGTMISGLLETAINSDLPGQIRAVVNEDVYSFDGRRILIPIGSRLIGEYQSEVTRGQSRVFVVWSRLIRSDGVSVRLNSMGSDSLGRSGMTGLVDTKFKERFTSALMLSVLGGGINYLTDSGGEPEFEEGQDDDRSARQKAADGVAQTMADFISSEIEANANLKPTISIDQGERVFVYVRQDLSFAAMYEDPITEAMRQIVSERR